MEYWWKNSVGYQIYIKSFYDSNADGVGDLNGIIEKLDYIKSLGVDFIWICPFYDSPMDDNGYDVRDYFKIATSYGTMTDFARLVIEAHNRDLKVIIDLVLNHTSDEHQWFSNSELKIDPYTDYYIWRDGNNVLGKIEPPNNWQSFFSGSAWKYSEKRKQYYLKLFSDKMPDLNFENKNVLLEIEKIIAYYSKLNVDGFRLDAISHIAKDLTFASAKNEEKTYKSFSNLPKTHDYLKQLSPAFKLNNMVTMGELGGNPSKSEIIKYTTDHELDMTFSFEQVNIFKKNKRVHLGKLKDCLMDKYYIAKNGGYPVLFWLNHDYPRLMSKISGEKDSKNAQICLAALMYLMKGTPIIYNGEEIGMENYKFTSPAEFRDVNAKMYFENAQDKAKALDYLTENSRDNSRTIMQWNSEKFAGFTTEQPWTYVGDNYKICNVAEQEKDKDSILENYKKILKVRKMILDLIDTGRYDFFKKFKMVGYTISHKNESLIVMANLGKVPVIMPHVKNEILYSNMPSDRVTVKPYQVIVLNRGKAKYDGEIGQTKREIKKQAKKSQ